MSWPWHFSLVRVCSYRAFGITWGWAGSPAGQGLPRCHWDFPLAEEPFPYVLCCWACLGQEERCQKDLASEQVDEQSVTWSLKTQRAFCSQCRGSCRRSWAILISPLRVCSSIPCKPSPPFFLFQRIGIPRVNEPGHVKQPPRCEKETHPPKPQAVKTWCFLLSGERCICSKGKTWRGYFEAFFFFFCYCQFCQPVTSVLIFQTPPMADLHLFGSLSNISFPDLQVAIKSIRKDKIKDEQDMVHIRREIEIMSSLNHPHIISIYEGQWFFFFSCWYQLPFLIPRGLPRFLGNCPSGQEPSIFPHDAKIAGCYLLFGYLEPNQTRGAAHFGHELSPVGAFFRLPSSLAVAKQPT